MMRELIAGFADQIDHAVSIAVNTRFQNTGNGIQNVVVTGLGGSGIGGKIIAQLVQDSARVPISINNDYLLPAFVSEKSLVVVSSYSGNTEETVAAMKEALKRGARVACITSGGEVAQLAAKHKLDVVSIPGGQPPRSQFGYSAMSLLRIFDAYGISSNCFDGAEKLGAFIRKHSAENEAKAKEIAGEMDQRIPIIYAESRNEGIAIRWRQQINENSKQLCWHHVYPEMNHNELVGWEGGDHRFVVLMLRSDDDHPRSVARMNITEPMMADRGARIVNILAGGKNRLERSFDLIHLGDWLSLILAEKNTIDPVSIVAIDYLKNALSTLK
jgi:glucose/mannose-6-phosphate isomerase